MPNRGMPYAQGEKQNEKKRIKINRKTVWKMKMAEKILIFRTFLSTFDVSLCMCRSNFTKSSFNTCVICCSYAGHDTKFISCFQFLVSFFISFFIRRFPQSFPFSCNEYPAFSFMFPSACHIFSVAISPFRSHYLP